MLVGSLGNTAVRILIRHYMVSEREFGYHGGSFDEEAIHLEFRKGDRHYFIKSYNNYSFPEGPFVENTQSLITSGENAAVADMLGDLEQSGLYFKVIKKHDQYYILSSMAAADFEKLVEVDNGIYDFHAEFPDALTESRLIDGLRKLQAS